MATPEALGSIGIDYLEQAVLAAMGDETLKCSEIRERIGAFNTGLIIYILRLTKNDNDRS